MNFDEEEGIEPVAQAVERVLKSRKKPTTAQDHAQTFRLREKQLRHLRHGDHGRPQRGRASHDESPDQAQDERRQKQDAHSKHGRSGRRSDRDARRSSRGRTRDLPAGTRTDRRIPPDQYRKRRRRQSQLSGHGFQEALHVGSSRARKRASGTGRRGRS